MVQYYHPDTQVTDFPGGLTSSYGSAADVGEGSNVVVSGNALWGYLNNVSSPIVTKSQIVVTDPKDVRTCFEVIGLKRNCHV